MLGVSAARFRQVGEVESFVYVEPTELENENRKADNRG
jgi:hypothetical protein